MLQVLVVETTGSHEDHLQLFPLRDHLSKQADFFRLVFLGVRLDLIELVGASWDRITGLEFLCVDRVPVKEEVGDGAVIF